MRFLSGTNRVLTLMILGCSLGLPGFAQTPGGIEAPRLWLMSEVSKGSIALMDRQDGQECTSVAHTGSKEINYHPVVDIDGQVDTYEAELSRYRKWCDPFHRMPSKFIHTRGDALDPDVRGFTPTGYDDQALR